MTASSRPAPGTHRGPPRGPRRVGSRIGTALSVKILLVAMLGALLATAGPVGAASAATVPCGSVLWATCDTRTTDNGYQYRYQGGELIRVPLGSGPVAGGTGCGATCPPDPAAVCDLLLAVGPSPNMTAQELADYNQAVAGCQAWLADPTNGIPLATVRAQLADYLKNQLLPKPTLTIQPGAHSFTGLQTIVYTQIPPAFAFNVDQPVLATITAVPTYHWDFGDGATGPNSPGRPYDAAISPRDFPDAYVDHEYKQPGPYQITLTVVWDGTFTVPGVAQAFALNAVTLVATAPVVVDEATGVLTGNG
ncbi:PKD domain-containing protein [Frankia sp. AgB1.9]|uniref:PKD domain-containing protein n=1 Tax=unclassified Frankia TaxID=2632575 RepID=UPI001934A2F4|nr:MULTISPECIES: PKD domain-containing protein [unclassified Frankia]MBL7494554.1 PKD domain-containing protein [Frankia sp. AgW1.1]MBL7552932.1 PKD domain-containing protein [Frankia sp. AgB1.9]MBL7622219.1 PKD domain-containing protein [Frankia sp. AgB1.8]